VRRALGILLLAASLCGAHASAASLAVEFENASRATRCAEEDNVYVKVSAENIASFRIRAEHPTYIGSIRKDSTAPDFTTCDMSGDPRYHFKPFKGVLYEDASIRLTGHRFETFWRPEEVSFHVGNLTFRGLHLVQLIRRTPRGDIEILVVYPSDGYWRVKPLPPATLPDTAYGSSFLIGPVVEQGRPFVPIRSIRFEPSRMQFRIVFANQTRGMLTVTEASPARTDLAVQIDPPVGKGQPLAALRSMFVTADRADVAVASWNHGSSTVSSNIMQFTKIQAHAARFGRVEPSTHNLSAPDLVFDAFARAAQR